MDEMRRFVGIDVAKVALDVFIGSVGRGILRTRYSRSRGCRLSRRSDRLPVAARSGKAPPISPTARKDNAKLNATRC